MNAQAEQVLLGGSGMLGRAMAACLEARGSLSMPSHASVDVCDRDALVAALPEGVRLVVNCTAYTDVDGAEQHEREATRLNGDAVAALAERCRVIGATLVHFSTDYVFSGEASEPYPVDAPRAPLNAYGRSKAAGELALEQSGAAFLCVRTSWLYAPWGKNFVLTMASLAGQRDELKVVNDQRGRPTSCTHLAETTLRLLDAGKRGQAHVTDGGECSWFELASHVVAQVRPETRVLPCSSAEFPRPAPRPAYSVLALTETEQLVGPMPSWQSAVSAALATAARAQHAG